MRKKSRAMDSEWALEVMHKAPYITVSFIDEEGKPYGLPLSLASDDDSIEGAILCTLQSTGSLITRELRAACGFTEKGMRSKFDGYLTRLEMATYIVTSTITNMAVVGRCSILPKISMAGRLANATVLPWNLTRRFSNI